MILQIAWKNIWRNKIRSFVILLAMAIGIMAGVFSVAVMKGMMYQRVESAINNEVSSVQLHHASFIDNNEIKYTIDSIKPIIKLIKCRAEVKAVCRRLKFESMLSSPRAATGAMVIGIDLNDEKNVTEIYKFIDSTDGTYFNSSIKNPIVLSKKIAELLKVKLKSKIEISGVNLKGEAVRDVFRVVGIYKTSNTMFDGINVFVKNSSIEALIGFNSNQAHEIAIATNPIDNSVGLSHFLENTLCQFSVSNYTLIKIKNDSLPASISTKLNQLLNQGPLIKAKFLEKLKTVLNATEFETHAQAICKYSQSGISVESWQELSPDLGMSVAYLDFILYIFLGIILLAMGFGIVNTMLMVVLERTRELGMLISIGMNKRRVFLMILTETVLLSLTGALVGMLFSWILIVLTQRSGINLSSFSEGLEAVGYSSIIYPSIELADYIKTTLMVISTGIAASIYPALKAIKLKPAVAVRQE